MKRKLYTLNHDPELLKEIALGGRFTAEERAYIVEKELGGTLFKTRDDLLRGYLSANFTKLSCLGFLVDIIKKNEHKNILSLGAGECVLEYLLKMSLPKDSQVVACDFDAFTVMKAKEFFPEIIVERFDFLKMK